MPVLPGFQFIFISLRADQSGSNQVDITSVLGEDISISVLDYDLSYQPIELKIRRCASPPCSVANGRVKKVFRTQRQEYVSILDSPASTKVIVF